MHFWLQLNFKYLRFLINDALCFKSHIQHVTKKLKLLSGFDLWIKACFSFCVKRKLVESTFLPVIDNGDVLYINASAHCLRLLDSMDHGALRLINCRSLTHITVCCTVFIYKDTLTNFLFILSFKREIWKSILVLSVFCHLLFLKSKLKLGKKAFKFSAPTAWNNLQTELNSEYCTTEQF